VLSNQTWEFCKKIESRFGFNRSSEILCAILTFVISGPKIWKLFKRSNQLIIVTVWMPAYLGNISEVLLRLRKDGFKVVIFPEWQKIKEPQYNKEIEKFNCGYIYYNAHRALPLIKSKIFLSSTARKHFYFSKSNKFFFYFHSVAGLNGFPIGGMDDYTDFLCATDQQLEELKSRFADLGYKKNLHAAGYPKFDLICKRLNNEKNCLTDFKASKLTILVAPSYASDDIYATVSMLSGIELLIDKLLESNFRVIFRPHPVSLRRGEFIEKIEKVKSSCLTRPDFFFDETQDYFETYCKSDIMVTDVSGTSMIFKVAFKKPVIFFTPNPKEALDAFNLIEIIGPVTNKVEELTEMINIITNDNTYGEPQIFNSGDSVRVFVDILKG
jgi:hypothetical protein